MIAATPHIEVDSFESVSIRRNNPIQCDPRYSDAKIVFVRGLAHSPAFFDEWSTSLALNSGIRASAPDLRVSEFSGSINQFSLADYKNCLARMLEREAQDAKKLYVVLHSMGGRCGAELLAEGRLPPEVSGMAFLNPVPLEGVAISATCALAQSSMPLPFMGPMQYLYALARGDVHGFLIRNPERAAFLFFSDGGASESRIINGITAQEFCDSYLCDESRRVAFNIMLPSHGVTGDGDFPITFFGSANDRVIFESQVRNMADAFYESGHVAVSFVPLDGEISHDIPMDIDNQRVLSKIIDLFRESCGA